ncbi:MAG: YggS family pyridoxal phosphate-dependent enzyme [Prevotella sp.]|nr:YggS family pyridoxal phosphate-dependent enzyme [Candidatus Prevotella equi]
MIKDNLNDVLASLKDGVQLVAVSKYHPIEAVEEAYAAGQRIFGESREQELRIKYDTLPKDIQWHFIGHLQTNKVKYIAPYISMIETVDSLRLLREIEKQGEKCDRVINILLELHLAQEETKSGMTTEECRELLKSGEWKDMKHVNICGIMMMASNTDDETEIRREFNAAQDFFNEIKTAYFTDKKDFTIKSYGMSGDYLIAQECGSNHVRVGSKIFSF